MSRYKKIALGFVAAAALSGGVFLMSLNAGWVTAAIILLIVFVVSVATAVYFWMGGD